MLKRLTLQNDSQDYCLKVLWIEDELPEDIPSNLSRHFNIWRAWEPEDIRGTLRQDLNEIYSQLGEAKSYSLPCLPVDGFLADFNLLGAGKTAESRVIDQAEMKPYPDPPSIKNIIKTSESDSTRPSGRNPTTLPRGAEAAGLTAAVLTALNFDYHPAVIVPYTAYQEQLSRQRALIRLLVPVSLVISQKSELDLGKKSLEKKLQQFAEDYRNNLPIWASQDIVSLPSGEAERLRSLAESRFDKKTKQVMWEDQDCLIIDTRYGLRQILCGSLWYRFDSKGPSLAEVIDWLDKMPIPTDVYSAAVRLANEYWLYSETDTSRYRYTLSRLIRSLKTAALSGDLSSIQARIALLCRLFDVDYATALESPSRVKMAKDKFVPHLLVSGASREVKRLAVFMLLVMEYAARWASTQHETDSLWKLSRIVDYQVNRTDDSPIRTFDELNVEHINGVDLEMLKELGYGSASIKQGELLIHRLEVCDADMAQRLDPLPESLLTTEENFSGGRIYQRLKDIDIDLDALIANTKKAGIRDDERREVQLFALSIDYRPAEEWPEWLKRNYI